MRYIWSWFRVFFIFIILHFLFLTKVQALNSELPNNKFGIHFALPSLEDLQKTQALVNSKGGDWGYVTLVVQENDRDKNKWQEVFDKMRELHLIPIVRLATVPEGAKWRKPTAGDIDAWVNFLDSLHWVIKDRYVVLFNEPNHGAEWGGVVDTNDYARIAHEFAKKLKAKNSDFFIMLAGLDASAPHSPPTYYDEGTFLSEVISNITADEYNSLFSGLASHSYPNPGFSGSPYNTGRKSIRAYEWELSMLKQLGVRELPVFITETGWIRGSEETIANYFEIAFRQIWSPDSRVVAVTPFIFDYQGEPFINFSWKLPSARSSPEREYYQQFYTVQSLPKVAGMPQQIEKGSVEFDLPKDLVTQSSYRFNIKLKNQGQAVWDRDFGYKVELKGEAVANFEYISSDLKRIKPFDEADIDLFLKTNEKLGKGEVQVVLTKHGEVVLDGGIWNFETFPLPSLDLQVKLFPKLTSEGDDFEVQIFNNREELVLKRSKLKINKGRSVVNEVQNVALGRKYRVVLIKPYYLPRQAMVTFHKGMNEIKFERMLPLDFNPDGKLDLQDAGKLLSQPKNFILLFP